MQNSWFQNPFIYSFAFSELMYKQFKEFFEVQYIVHCWAFKSVKNASYFETEYKIDDKTFT